LTPEAVARLPLGKTLNAVLGKHLAVLGKDTHPLLFSYI